jgi:antitoxin component YwqK of YwqJK toxin-antitoxin module
METKIERTYHKSGKLWSERACVNKVPHGVSKWWCENGQLWLECPYVDGKRHGMEKWWYLNGGIGEFYLYNQDELVAKFNPQNEAQRWKLK